MITDWALGRERPLSQLEAALSVSTAVAVQHRHPEATGRQFFEEGHLLAELSARLGNPLFVNDRLDVALLLRAHLHLPAHGFLPGDVKPFLPAGTLVSTAVHDENEALAAEGADLALVSPVFSPGSKPSDARAPLGVEGYRRLAEMLHCPAFALGGMTPELARALGAPGVAAISAVLSSATPAEAASAFLRG